MEDTAETVQGVVGSNARYRLIERIGSGGVGEVFLGEDTQLHRSVAVKKLRDSVLADVGRRDEMMREARHLAALQHPNIVTLFDFVEDGDDVLVVMELLKGQTVQDIAEKAPMIVSEFTEMMRQSLEGLIAAHTLGMLHRDIKPSNLMILDLPSGAFQVKILDFGLAKIVQGPSLQTVDASGSLLGSIYTMAPEQFDGSGMDTRSDLYSLGCVGYFALTSRYPFPGETVAEVIHSHLQHGVASLSALRTDLPESLVHWVMRLMERDPADRPQSAAFALRELQTILSEKTTPVPQKRIEYSPAPSASAPQAGWAKHAFWMVPALVVATVSGLWMAGLFGGSEPAAPSAVKITDNVPPVEEEAAPPPAPGAASTGASVKKAPTPVNRLKLEATRTAELTAAIGRPVEVSGKIARGGVSKSGATRFLNFDGTSRGDLTLVFFVKEEPEAFTRENLDTYIGKDVRVSGLISLYEGTPQIVIRSLDQIEVVSPN